MKINKIVLDVQHMGKPHNPVDRGAFNASAGLIESDLCLKYASIAYQVLTAKGFEPFLVTSGYYGFRAGFSNQIEADLYIACHLNSFGGGLDKNYGLIEVSEYAGDNTVIIAGELMDSLIERKVVKTAHVRKIKKGKRGWTCINRVKAPAILFEPLFISHPELLEYDIKKNLYVISSAIVDAVENFNLRG
jgi:N-acetylmuramoyl-L-alanine amidase